MEEKRPVGKYIIAAVVTIILIAAVVAYGAFRTFSSCETKSEAALSDSGRTQYAGFAGNVVGYSRDGISCLDYDGNLLWTASFEMGSPQTVARKNYFLVYDRGGTEIHVYDKDGGEKVISTDLPVERADLAENGASAAIMSDGGTHVVNLYGADGKIAAGGELHTEISGYPIAAALSTDGKRMVVSILDLTLGTVKTTVRFYDFSEKGDAKANHIAAEFSYSDMTVPYVCFFTDGRAAAFGDDQIMLYSSAAVPAETGDVFVSDTEIRSVAASGTGFALVTGKAADGEDAAKETLAVYSESGRERFSKELDFSYNDIYYLSNGELLLTDGSTVELYTDIGVRKFSETFENGINALLPWDGATNYVVVADGKLKKAHLKS